MIIDQDKCIGCEMCIDECTMNAIVNNGNTVDITSDCVNCFCPAQDICPKDAIIEG